MSQPRLIDRPTRPFLEFSQYRKSLEFSNELDGILDGFLKRLLNRHPGDRESRCVVVAQQTKSQLRRSRENHVVVVARVETIGFGTSTVLVVVISELPTAAALWLVFHWRQALEVQLDTLQAL